jgi:hypothetical protein
MRCTPFLLATLLRLALVPSASAQATIALVLDASVPGGEQGEYRRGPGAGLATSYTLSLASDWPQLSAGGSGCMNGGQELLSGTLNRNGEGAYSGQLERRATIYFCGAHGAAQSACALTLSSTGPVQAEGHLLPATRGSAPVVELRWAAAGASDVTISGDCAPSFNASLRRLYLGVTHALEFPLPLAGEGPRSMRLEDYGWIVDVQ